MESCQRINSLDDLAIKNFQKYLQIPTVHPDIDYEPAVEFLRKLADEMQLPSKVYYISPKKPVLIITWKGTQPNLPSILLCSHVDVVPVYEDKWTYKPFGAEIANGMIYARGTQDMKNVGIQHLEAVRRLIKQGVKLLRTVHLLYLPDEEIAGSEGMKQFVNTKEFKDLNAGIAFDEAMASENDEYYLFNGEKSTWHTLFHCQGNPCHGSQLLRNTASDKAITLLKRIKEFRDKQVEQVESGTAALEEIISINVTKIEGGLQENIVPSEIFITADCRLPPDVNLVEWEAMLKQWCREAGENVTYRYLAEGNMAPSTKLNDSLPYWVAMKEVFQELGMKVKVQICPGATNAQFIRQKGIAAVGFTPLINSKILLHGNDECIGVKSFLDGIPIFCKIITKVANVK